MSANSIKRIPCASRAGNATECACNGRQSARYRVMKSFTVGKNVVAQDGACYVIAEIGNNHQGDLKTTLNMIKVAAGMGVNAVKFQKRDNKTQNTQAKNNKPNDNKNSKNTTYGEH